MRPVNLIPLEDRRGQHAPARSGRLTPYVVVGALVLALGGVTLMVLTSNEISESKAKVVELKQEEAQLEVRAQALASYTAFRSLRDARSSTVASLADSRFDWERVLRELSLVLPDDVWLTSVAGTASPGVTPPEGSSIPTRSAIAGPALELVGCAQSQDAVAGLVSALNDIDGVTRVGVAKSELPDLGTASTAVSGDDSGDDCRTRDFIARFEIVAAFDAAPVAGASGAAPAVAAPTAAAPAASDSSGVADAANDENLARQSIETTSDKARNAITTFTP